jgi:hypothetical protein
MPLLDYVKIYGPDVAKLLDVHERLLAMAGYSEPLIGDESRLGRTVDELTPRMRRHIDKHGPPPPDDKFVQGFDPLMGGVLVNYNRIDRFMGGISGEGGPESVAGRFWRAMKRPSDGLEYIAVTGRRLLVLSMATSGEATSGDQQFRIVFEVPRSAVASARRAGKLLLQRGRVEVRFTDGSMKAFTTAMLSTARARSLVAALSERHTES